MIEVTHFTDPGCPWAYSAWPAHTTLRWRYGDALSWRLVTIGLAASAERYIRAGYSPARMATGYLRTFKRFGMPFQYTPKPRLSATAPACRALVATRLQAPGREHAALRALQFAQFTSTAVLEDPQTLRDALATVDGLDAGAIVAGIDDPAVVAAYEEDRAWARTAAGSPTEFQGRAANSDGAVRYTAPSLVMTRNGRTLEAGGFQPVEAYDVVIANLDPTLPRRPPATDPIDVLEALPYAPTTAEVAAVMTEHLGEPDPVAVEAELIAAAADGRVARRQLGDGALWELSPAPGS